MSAELSLWMGDIDESLNEAKLLSAFNYYNSFPSYVKLIYDKQTKKLKSYCFIIFDTYEKALYTLEVCNKKPIIGTNKKFNLNWANVQSYDLYKSIYVGHLSPLVTDHSLYELFKSRYPSVHHACVIKNSSDEASKCYGFVSFTDDQHYYRSFKEMNNFVFKGMPMIIKEQQRKKEEEEDTKEYNNMHSKCKLIKNNIGKKNNNLENKMSFDAIEKNIDRSNGYNGGYFISYNNKIIGNNYNNYNSNSKNVNDKELKVGNNITLKNDSERSIIFSTFFSSLLFVLSV